MEKKFSPIEVLQQYTWYDNEHIENEKHVSASSFANETLELWFQKYKYPREEKIGDATIGSMVHMALEKIFNDDTGRFVIEQRLTKFLDDYTISGKPDMIDRKERVIWDFKTGKNYSKKSLEKEGKYHRYAIQLAVYNWLLDCDYTGKIFWIFKDSSAPKNEPVFVEQEVEIMNTQEIEDYMREKITILDAYDKDTMPEACKDLWIRNINKVVMPTKCMFYCGYKNVCPHFNINPKQAVSAW